MGGLTGLVDRLGELPSAVTDDANRIDAIAALEKVKAAAGAAQAHIIAEFATSQRAANTAMGIPPRLTGRGIPEQVGLARRVSPASAARQVAQASALIEQLPGTFALWRRGDISEHVATIVATETSHLAAPDRRLVDEQLAGQLAGLSPKRAHAAARRLAIQAGPSAAVARAGRAREDRRVGVRPAPDTMTVLTALLPCEQGVAAYAALRRHADTLTSAGDERSRDQIMADTLVQRLTGQASPGAVSAEIALVMTDATLFAGDDTPADLTGYGPIPATLARTIASSDAERARVFLRRLFTDPATGIVNHADPRRRRFDGALADLLIYRDRACRDPYCDAPIRHLDHIRAHAAGGSTTLQNGRGVCERGNYVKQMPGWTTRLADTRQHVVETTTPTGHTYRSVPPPAPAHTHEDECRVSRAAR